MPPSRPRILHWLVLLLGLSLIVNVVLLSLLSRRSNRPAATLDQNRGGVRLAAVDRGSKNDGGSPRVETQGLPSGYKMILRGHPGSITAVAFAPDCSKLGIITDPGYITVWNLGSRELSWEAEIPRREQGHGPIDALAFSPSGDRVAYLVREESPAWSLFSLHIRDLRTGQERTLRDDRLAEDLWDVSTGLAYSPDGRTVAVGYRKGVALFDVEQGIVRRVLRAERRFYYRMLCYSESGTSLLTLASPGIGLFDIPSGKIVADMRVTLSRYHDAPCNAILSPDASRIAAGFLSNEVSLCNSRPGEKSVPIKEGLGTGWSDGSCPVGVARDGESILTASRSEEMSHILVRRRKSHDGGLIAKREIVQPGGNCPYLYPRLFSSDGGKLALTGSDHGTRFIPAPNMGIVTVRESVVGILDTSLLLDGEPIPQN